MRRQRNQSLGFITSHSFRLCACFWLGFRLRFLLSLFLCSSHELVRQAHLRAREVRHLHRRRTLYNFCHLRLAPARGSDPKKKGVIHSPQFLSTRPSTCQRFRPEKKVRSTLHNFCRLGLAPAQGSDPKKKMRSTLHNFCQLGLAPARGSDPKKRKVRSTLHNFCQLGLAHAPDSDPKK